MLKKWADKWVKALRSGKFKQGKRRLTNIDSKGNELDCCLGVLCKITKTPREIVSDNYYRYGIEGEREYGRLPYSVMAKTGVKDKNGIIPGKKDKWLSELNDNGKSF